MYIKPKEHFFYFKKSQKKSKTFLIGTKGVPVDCENKAIEGKGGEKIESNGTSPSAFRDYL